MEIEAEDEEYEEEARYCFPWVVVVLELHVELSQCQVCLLKLVTENYDECHEGQAHDVVALNAYFGGVFAILEIKFVDVLGEHCEDVDELVCIKE